MNLKCIVSIVCLSCTIAVSQNPNRQFIKHLAGLELFTEQQHYLSSFPDTLSYPLFAERAWVSYALGEKIAALKWYGKIPFDTMAASPFLNNYARLLIASDSLALIEPLIRNSSDTSFTSKINLCINLLNRKYPAESPLSDNLHRPYKSYLKIHNKHLGIATGLSVLLPGMGKIYMGKKQQGLNMLLINLIFAAQATESYIRSGPESFRFIAFGTLFATFYTGNVYGTIKGFKKARRDSKKELLYEIENYTLSDYAAYPY